MQTLRRFVLGSVVSALGCVPLSAQLGPEQIRSLVEAEAVPSIELFREYLGLPNDAHLGHRPAHQLARRGAHRPGLHD